MSATTARLLFHKFLLLAALVVHPHRNLPQSLTISRPVSANTHFTDSFHAHWIQMHSDTFDDTVIQRGQYPVWNQAQQVSSSTRATQPVSRRTSRSHTRQLRLSPSATDHGVHITPNRMFNAPSVLIPSRRQR
jgi:hypothetical protein